MNKELLHDKIENYLLGKLPPEEAADFESQMAEDTALAEQAAIQRLALMGLEQLAKADLRENFARWDAELDIPPEIPPPKEFPVKTSSVWPWISAVLLGILAIGAFLFFNKPDEKDNSNQQMDERDSIIALLNREYKVVQKRLDSLLLLPSGVGRDTQLQAQIKILREELERKDEVIRRLEKRNPGAQLQAVVLNAAPVSAYIRDVKARRGADESDATIKAANEAFEARNFAEAERLLKSIPPNGPQQAEVLNSLPYVLFYAGKFEEAIPAFLDLKEKDRFEKMPAEWYLLLCYIAEGRQVETQWMLQKIMSDPKHRYREQAKKMQEKIK